MRSTSTGARSVSRSIVSGLLLSLVLAGPAWADDLDDLINTMRTGQRQSSELKSKMDVLTAQNERDKKEYDAYSSSFGQLEMEKKAKKDKFAEDAKGPLKSADDMVERWNSRCAADRVGELSEAAYNACIASKAQVEPEVARIRAAVNRDAEIYHRDKIAPIEAIQQRQQTEMDKIGTRIKARFVTWDDAKHKYDALMAKLEEVRAAVIDGCKAATTIEALKHCYSIGWDGARKDLPPL